jgi:cell division protein FtsA
VLQRGWIGGSPRRVTGVLDIGTSKIACLIAAVETGLVEDGSPGATARVLGVGHQKAHGVKGGVITDLDEAENAVRTAIAQAERMAGVMLEEVRLSVACGRLKSRSFAASTPCQGGVVTDEDLTRIYAGAQAFAERDARALLHLNQVSVRLDGAPGALDPRGMAARELAVDLHAVTVDEAPLRNLLLVVERCYLASSSLVPSPYASALGATDEEERRLGVTCVDIGGGNITIAMFAEDRFLKATAAPFGGNQLTFDVARTLHTPLAEAERIKALYGTVVRAQSDEHEIVSYPTAGGEDGGVQHTTKARLAEIILPRVHSWASYIREQIEGSGLGDYAGRRIVLTGGSAQLVGIAEFMSMQLGRPVRVAFPQSVSGLPPNVSSPAFSGAAGLLLAEVQGIDGSVIAHGKGTESHGYLERVGAWLREGF